VTEERGDRNRLGPIAESYDELQSLDALLAVVRAGSAPPAGSAWQAVRALYQGGEVAVVTLARLADTVTEHVVAGELAQAARAMDWMGAFGATFADLAWRVRDIAPRQAAHEAAHRLDIARSPNWAELRRAETALCDALLASTEHGNGPADIGDQLTHRLLHYVMLQRQGLEYFATGGAPAGYADLVCPEPLRAAVLERELGGRTVFGQFRAAHQIPEILVDAVNDHLEAAITAVRAHRLTAAAVTLGRTDRLLDAVVRSAELLADNLYTWEYHEIRENLGMTSGSHSTGLHFHLMRDLYPQLRREVARLEESDVDDTDGDDGAAGVAALVRGQAHTVGLHLDRWRLTHLNLPRNNLGGAGTDTRSLTGARDAVSLVGNMRDRAARREDDGSFHATDWDTTALALAPIERRLLDHIARRTQARFPEVQHRSGYFAAKPTFQPPAERTVGNEERDT
jgi:hypothetical protein